MKRFILFLSLALTNVFVFAQTEDKMYSEKSGKVTYLYEIDGEKALFSIVFDDYGKKQVMDITNKVDGFDERLKTVITEDKMFLVNYSDEQVIILPVVGENSMDMAAGADMGVDVDAIVRNVTGTGSAKIGTENLLGNDCSVFEHTDGEYKGKYWIYNDHLIKAEFIAAGVHTYMEAKEMKFGINVPASVFEVPTGFTVIDMAQQMQQMQIMMDEE